MNRHTLFALSKLLAKSTSFHGSTPANHVSVARKQCVVCVRTCGARRMVCALSGVASVDHVVQMSLILLRQSLVVETDRIGRRVEAAHARVLLRKATFAERVASKSPTGQHLQELR
jgi:hypothetical protein